MDGDGAIINNNLKSCSNKPLREFLDLLLLQSTRCKCVREVHKFATINVPISDWYEHKFS